MKILSSFLSIPKRGNNLNENEDCFFPEKPEIIGNTISYAIADGASEGFLSSIWSKILTYLYSEHNNEMLDFEEYLTRCINRFNNIEKKYLKWREIKNIPLKWYESNLLLKGSFSTLAAISFYEGENSKRYFKMYSIGDSCIFHLRKEKLISSYPTDDPDYFGNNPILISTKHSQVEYALDNLFSTIGKYKIDDYFYLMTDAIAHWFILESVNGNKPWLELNKYPDLSSDEFKKYVADLRDSNKIKNDDVTIARVSFK